MSYPELLEREERAPNYFSTTQLYSNILSYFKLGRSVHPSEPITPQYSEFIEISARRRIRIIHIKPENTTDEKIEKRRFQETNPRRSFRLSTEEYWFMRWNRPMRNACNCSFRRSQRFSKLSDRLSIISNPNTNLNQTENKFQVENYAEKLIHDILVAAFNEYNIINKKNYSKNDLYNGIINFSYNTSHDEVDSVITFRNKNLFNKDWKQSINVQNNKNDSLNNESSIKNKKIEKQKCLHSSHSDKKKKPIVLLLHGIGSSAEIWWDVLQCLVCANFEIIAPDMLGHGYSSVPDCAKAYTFANLLKDTITIFDKYVSATDLEQCIVIGHSFGCSLATALAKYREQQVVQLVLISGGGPTPLAPPVSSAEVSDFSCMRCFMQPLLLCGIKRTMFYSSRGKHFEACEEQTAIPSYVIRYISEGQNWPEGDAAFHRRILIPTLLVHGLQDKFVTLVQECEMERTIPRSFLEVIPTAGHLAMVETPEQLCHMLLCFFEWWKYVRTCKVPLEQLYMFIKRKEPPITAVKNQTTKNTFL